MSDRPYEYLLSIGSNVEPERSIARGLALLTARFKRPTVSPWYDVDAMGAPGQPPFVNLAVLIATDLPPPALRVVCRRIEEACGRRRGADRFAPRTLDVAAFLARRAGALDRGAHPRRRAARQPFATQDRAQDSGAERDCRIELALRR